MEVSLPEYPIRFPNKLEIELDISFIYKHLKIKGAMEEETGFNGFTPSDYANGLYEDAKVNAQRRDRLQRRLDKLTREQRQDLKQQKLDAQINQSIIMIGKLMEALIPFFLQLALGFAVLGWIINEDEKNAKEADEINKRYNNKRTRE